jgi:hypothetical protein
MLREGLQLTWNAMLESGQSAVATAK